MRRRSGLTILEALIAVGVLGVVVAALASLQLSNLQTTRGARLDTTRLEVAVARFEQEKRAVEADFASYLTCTPATCSSGPEIVQGAEVNVSVTGRPNVVPTSGSPVATRGLVEIVVSVDDGTDTLTLRQFVSCLSASGGAAPSVANPGVACE